MGHLIDVERRTLLIAGSAPGYGPAANAAALREKLRAAP